MADAFDDAVDRFVDKWAMKIVVALLAIIPVGMAAISIWAFWPHKTISLDARDWNCSRGHYERHLTMAGKVLVPITQYYCDEYERAAG